MLFDGDVEIKFWAEACNTAAYVMNRTPRIRLENKTPMEMWSGKKPDVSNLRIFGSKVMVHIPKENRKKWSAKASEMIFIGYDLQKKGFRCFDANKSKVIVSRDVKFFETLSSTVMMNGDEQTEKIEEQNDSIDDDYQSAENSESVNTSEQGVSDESQQSDASSDLDETIVNQPSTSTPNGNVTTAADADDTMSESTDDQNDTDYKTRARADLPSTPRKGSRERKQVRPFQVVHFALFVGEPQTVKEAFVS